MWVPPTLGPRLLRSQAKNPKRRITIERFHTWGRKRKIPSWRLLTKRYHANRTKRTFSSDISQGKLLFWLIPSERCQASLPKRKSPSEGHKGPKGSKRTFLSERPRAESPRRKLRSQSSQARISKRRIPSKRSQAEFPERKAPKRFLVSETYINLLS